MAVFIPSLPENFNNSYGEEKVLILLGHWIIIM